jgi:L-methionine (R)-S-oxide reductase
MDKKKKESRYQRLFMQIEKLMAACKNESSRRATIIAVLHHKMDYFFWTGYYLLKDGELCVDHYQGPVACMKLKTDTGVCWAGINQKKTIVVADVHDFPGHIACDSRSNSEIVVPLKDKEGKIYGVLDVDSTQKSAFDEVDAAYLEKILELRWLGL